MEQLRTLAQRADAHERELTDLKVTQATLVVRVSLIGAAVGAVAGAIVSKLIGSAL